MRLRLDRLGSDAAVMIDARRMSALVEIAARE
jgi:hypothetical protein